MCPLQALEGSGSPRIILMVLNSNSQALPTSTISGKDGNVDLKALISSPAFLEVNFQQVYPLHCVHFATQQLSLQHAGITLRAGTL